MQSSVDPVYPLHQDVLYPKLMYFLSFFGERLFPNGLCSGYAFMQFRAETAKDEETYWRRIRFLSAADNSKIKKMATLLREYLMRFALSAEKNQGLLEILINEKPSHAKEMRRIYYDYLDLLARSRLSVSDDELLVAAKDLRIFISSLLFSQKPSIYKFPADPLHPSVAPDKGAVNQDDFLEILKVIPPDALIQNPEKKLSEYVIAFNFTEPEITRVLDQVTRDQDKIKVSTTNHTAYVSKRGAYFFTDSNNPLGCESYMTTETLVKKILAHMFSKFNYRTDYCALGFNIYSDLGPGRPLPVDVIKELLAARGNNKRVNARAWSGVTALGMAAMHGCYDIAKELLITGADPNLISIEGNSPAYWAALHGNAAILDLLIEFNADYHLGKWRGAIALAIAKAYKHTKAIERIKYWHAEIAFEDFVDWEKKLQLPEMLAKTQQELRNAFVSSDQKWTNVAARVLYLICSGFNLSLQKLIREHPETRKIAFYFANGIALNFPNAIEKVDIDFIVSLCRIAAVAGEVHRHMAMAALMAARQGMIGFAGYFLNHYADKFTQLQLTVILLAMNNHPDGPLFNGKGESLLCVATQYRLYATTDYLLKTRAAKFTNQQIAHSLQNLVSQHETTKGELFEQLRAINNLMQSRHNAIQDLGVLAHVAGKDARKRVVAVLIIEKLLDVASSSTAVMTIINKLVAMKNQIAYLYQPHDQLIYRKNYYKSEQISVEFAHLILRARGRILALVNAKNGSFSMLDKECKDLLSMKITNRYHFNKEPSPPTLPPKSAVVIDKIKNRTTP